MNNTFYTENITKDSLAKMIDHTLLRSDAKTDEIKQLCKEAATFHFASVCVNPYFVPVAKKFLEELNASVKICTVIGFPLGATSSIAKAAEAFDSVKNGADEIDMVINICAALENRFDYVERDIGSVKKMIEIAAREVNRNVILKVILETCFLNDKTIEACCHSAVIAGADFVKTSTGFATPKDSNGKPLFNGAQARHVSLMRAAVGDKIGVKASGGIRTTEDALTMIRSGASRIGTSSGVKIISEL